MSLTLTQDRTRMSLRLPGIIKVAITATQFMKEGTLMLN